MSAPRPAHRPTRADLLHAAHAVHGVVLLRRPGVVVRVLGARHLVQGLAGLAAPQWVTPGLGAVVDTVHALSMVGASVLDRGHRRAAAVSALVAAAFALAGGWADRSRRGGLVVRPYGRAGCTTRGETASAAGSGRASGTM